jgi:hypothetical protein
MRFVWSIAREQHEVRVRQEGSGTTRVVRLHFPTLPESAPSEVWLLEAARLLAHQLQALPSHRFRDLPPAIWNFH